MRDHKTARIKDVLLKWAFLDPLTMEMLRKIDRVFDDAHYLAVNRDVAADGVDPFTHFLLHGLMEGRAPSQELSNRRCREACVAMLGSDLDLRRRLKRLRSIRTVSRGTVERLAGRTPGQRRPFWEQPGFATSQIDLCYIRNSGDWQAGHATIATALRQFAKEFTTGLRPFSHQLVPDVGFYGALTGGSLTALEIQQKWARADSSGDTIVSMAHFMQHHCADGSLVFDGFDHLDYIARNPRVDIGLNELQAFAHFISHGLEHGFRPPQRLGPALVSVMDARLEHLEKTGSSAFYRATFKLWQSGVRSDVIDRVAHQHAIATGVSVAADHETPHDRLQAFWTAIHSATALSERGQYRQAADHAQAALTHENGSVFALDKAHETVSLWHQDVHRSLQIAARSGAGLPAEKTISAQFTEVLNAIPCFHIGPATISAVQTGRDIRRIGIIADQSLPQCKRYRVDQKLEYLRTLGIEFTVFDVHRDAEKAAADCALFDAWIFYRTPAYYAVMKLLNRARALGLPTIFEIDDLIVDPVAFPEARESYGAGIDDHQFAELTVLPFLYAAVARNCDFGLASTQALSNSLGGLVRSGRAFVMPNGVDATHLSALSALVPAPQNRADDIVRIFVGSATKSHKDHVAQVFVPQAIRIAQAFPGKVHFSLCGEFGDLHAQLDAAARQSIGHIDLGWDYATYLSTLSGFDINVVPLEKSAFTDCKSEIKWLEAGLLGIPSVLASTDAYERCIEDGTTGLLVRDADYVTPISRLCATATERARIGAAARDAVAAGFSVERQCTTLGGILDQIGAGA
jgi:glycosyltransferase involved in cell wall biosynthesis